MPNDQFSVPQPRPLRTRPSPIHQFIRVPLREPGEDLKCGDAAGLPSVAMTRAARLLQGDTG